MARVLRHLLKENFMNRSCNNLGERRLEEIGVCPTCHWPLDESFCVEGSWIAFFFLLILLIENWKTYW
jgi:hypothetical protein